MKIPFVISVKSTEERDIDLPYFCRLKDRFYKVVSEDISIQVDPSPTYALANKCGTWLVKTEVGEAAPCTEQEFNEAYHKALFEIGKYVPAPPAPNELLNQDIPTFEEIEGEFQQFVTDNYKASPTHSGYYVAKNCDYPLLTIEQIREAYVKHLEEETINTEAVNQ